MAEFREAELPYPGLRPFDAHEADVFFGREEHTDRLLEILQRQRFLAVIGPSGSGKSSLVRAGLLPSLTMGSLGSGSDWRIAVLRPGDRPIDRLAGALLRPEVLGPEFAGPEPAQGPSDHEATIATLGAELRRGPVGLLHVVEAAQMRRTAASGSQPFNLLVLVDQFEELFTYAEAGGAQSDESDAFVSLLLAARTEPRVRIYVALTMRTDFLGNCVRFVDLPDAINVAQYLTPRLTRAQMDRAITGPARVFGGQVIPDLTAELINDIGQNSDQLPILQHALARMWRLASERQPRRPCIDWRIYRNEEIGGVHAALNRHADALFDHLPADEQPLAELLFRAITERRQGGAGGQDVRRPMTLLHIAEELGLGANWQALTHIVETFAARDVCFLQHGPTLDGHSIVDLSHEALIRQWRRLAGWVVDEARRAIDYRRWRDRAAEHRRGASSLLAGNDLARAVEWWNPDTAASGRGWQPTAAWAQRHSTDDLAEAGFQDTVDFIRESRDVAAASAAAEKARIQRELDDRAERAQVAEMQARRAQRHVRLLFVAGAALLVMTGLAVYALIGARDLARQAQELAESARRAETMAIAERQRADALAESQRRVADQQKAQLAIALTTDGTTAGTPPPAPLRAASARAITVDDLQRIMPGSTEERRRRFVDMLNATMKEFEIDTPMRQASFLAQIAGETSQLRFIEEVWRNSPAQLEREPPGKSARMFGNTEAGDGERFRGRGLFLLTGRYNYAKYGPALGLDLIVNPDLVATPEVAARVAGAFWKLNRLNALADTGNVEAITRRINGAAPPKILAERQQYFDRAKQALGLESEAQRC